MATNFTVCVPLKSFEVGPWKFKNLCRNEGCSSILLEYRQPSNTITVKIQSRDLITELGSFHLTNLSAQQVSLVYTVPGSLDSLVLQALMEVDEITYVNTNLNEVLEDESQLPRATSKKAVARKLRSHFVIAIADINETSSLTDGIRACLLATHGQSLKVGVPPRGFVADTSPGHPQFPSSNEQNVLESVMQPSLINKKQEEHVDLLLVPTLPVWSKYIPWWMYSKQLRWVLQFLITAYVLFSVVWAFWQLHRHFYLIQTVIDPLLIILKTYMAPLVNFLDALLSVFTGWWYHFINPLYVLLGTLFTPLIGTLRIFWIVLKPLFNLPIIRGVFWPFKTIWSIVANTRIDFSSFDVVRLRLLFVRTVILNSIKTIWNGFLALFKYSQIKKTQHRAKKAVQPGSKTYQPDLRKRTVSPAGVQSP